MGSIEKFCLRWNDFESNISGAFRELREDKDFFDVTLACDDDQIQAHKVILSACSPFFRQILKRNKHDHPLLYMKGVRYIDLVSVLNFMYHGEVNIAQEELNSFLATAEDLQVKGLTQNSNHRRGGGRDENKGGRRDRRTKSSSSKVLSFATFSSISDIILCSMVFFPSPVWLRCIFYTNLTSGNGSSVPPPQSLNGLGGGSTLQSNIPKSKDQSRLNKAGKKRLHHL